MKLIKTLIFVVIICFFLPMIALAQEFQANVRVDDTGDNVVNQYEPVVAVDDSGHVYVVWTDERNGHPDIYFAKSTDGGVSFGTNIKVNDANSPASHPGMVLDGDGHILVVWQDERNGNSDIYFTKSTNGGTTFEANVRVDDTGASTNTQSAPVIAVYPISNPIYVTWTDDRDSGTQHIYFTKSTNGGASFDTNVQVDDAGSSIPDYSALAIDKANNNIYVVWKDVRSGAPEVYFDKSTDGGVSFGTDIKVNDFKAASEYPDIIVDEDGNIYVTWHDYRNGDYDIYMAKSMDITPTFSGSVRIDDTDLITSTQRYPACAVNGSGRLYSVWEDERNGNLDIYLTQSIDLTLITPTFSANIRVDDTGVATTEQTRPKIAVDNSGYLYVVWQDMRKGFGDTDIYFATTREAPEISSGSSGEGSSSDWKCFIATVAYGTPMADEVMVLRRFRDKYLLPNTLGKVMVNTYYKLSPPIAEVISKHESLRGAVRIGLRPLINFARVIIDK